MSRAPRREDFIKGLEVDSDDVRPKQGPLSPVFSNFKTIHRLGRERLDCTSDTGSISDFHSVGHGLDFEFELGLSREVVDKPFNPRNPF